MSDDTWSMFATLGDASRADGWRSFLNSHNGPLAQHITGSLIEPVLVSESPQGPYLGWLAAGAHAPALIAPESQFKSPRSATGRVVRLAVTRPSERTIEHAFS